MNALSTYLDIKISRDGYIHHDHYERGIPTVELEAGLLPKLGKTRGTGTCVNFLPDPEIFEKTRFGAADVKSRLHETAYLNPELTIHFEDRRGDTPEDIEYHEPEGIVGFIRDLNKNAQPLHDPVYFKRRGRRDSRWKLLFSLPMSSVRTFSDSAIISTMQREELI